MSAATKVVRGVMLVLGAVGLFSAGLVGTLAARGKLNKEYLGPMFGMEMPKEHDPLDLKTPVRTVQPKPEPKPAPVEPKVMPAIMLPSPFSSEETDTLFAEIRQMRDDLKMKLAKVESDRRDLDLVRADLDRRFDELNLREQQLEQEARLLTGERSELSEKSVLVQEAEVENLKKLAADIEKMPAQAAAELLQKYTPDQSAKILTHIKARESGKILAALPADIAAKVAERMLGVMSGDSKSADSKKKEKGN
ncbi:MAG: hypothetical protein JNL94_20185 [Planctomycetes bacterium]|nr:hypothetical protein [Planctomycetota bacterium]